MAASFSRKNQFLRLLISLAVAAAAFFAGSFFLQGPKLGPHYDFLMDYTRDPPAARNLAIIETGTARSESGQYEEHILEPLMVTQVILALAEFNGESLVIHSPVLGVSSGGGQSGAELQDRFDEEFTLLGQNIRNLFQGIRVGSIPPGESERYVEDLVSLSERGKDRLLSAFMKKDEAGGRLMEHASDIFGEVWRMGGIRLPGPGPDPGAEQGPERGRWYSRPQPDGDGVFRRIAPVLPGEGGAEHIAFAAFRGRFQQMRFVREGKGRLSGAASRLVLVRNGEERGIPLDSQGRILIRKAREMPEIRRIPLRVFLDYERAEEELARILQTAENRGYFARLDPESWPSILYRYTRALREDMLENPSEEKKFRWLDFRGRFYRSMEALLDGPTETLLVNGYENLVASERLNRAGVERIVGMRDEMIASFTRMRELHENLLEIRTYFGGALSGTSCIMGTVSPPGTEPGPQGGMFRRLLSPSPNPTDAEVSAILANSLLAGTAVVPAGFNYLWSWCLGITLALLFLLRKSGPAATLAAGIIVVLLESAVFAFGFVFSLSWIDPLLPVCTSLAGVLASFFITLSMKSREAGRFRRAYQANIAPPYLRQVIRMGSPRPEELRQVKAAVIAVRHPELRGQEMRDLAGESHGAFWNFRKDVFRHFSRTGGTFLGADGDMVFIAYGSPLERVCLNSLRSEIPYEDEAQALSNNSPAAKAVAAVLDSLARPSGGEAHRWVFGIDAGICAFGWSEQGGYAAFGPPVIHARILSGLASRYRARILVSGRVIEKIDGVLSKKVDLLQDRAGTMKEPFYQLITEDFAAGSTARQSRP